MKQLMQLARADIGESLRARWFLVYTLVFGGVMVGLCADAAAQPRVRIGWVQRYNGPGNAADRWPIVLKQLVVRWCAERPKPAPVPESQFAEHLRLSQPSVFFG